MEKLDKFYKKINGNYFGLISVFVAAISITVAQLLYIAVDPTFSITTNFISDLGTGPNNSDVVFNIGMILTGIFFIPYFIYLGWYLQKKDKKMNLLIKGMIAGLIASIGLILVGFFPLDPENLYSYNMHIIAAGILFYGLLIMLLIYGISEYINPEIPNLLSILSFIAAILFGAFITIVIIQYSSATPFEAYTYIIEWIGLWATGVWAIAHIYYTLKNK